MVPSQILLSPLHFRAFHSPSCRLGQLTNTLMTWAEAAIDAGVSRCGPAYIFAAAALIGIVATVFFAAIIPEVDPRPRVTPPYH